MEPSTPIAYRGYSNKIVIEDYEQDSIVIVVTQNDTLKKVSDYFYYSGSKQKQDTLTAFKDGKIIAQKVYTIENLRNPKIFLDEIRDTLVTIEDILTNSHLRVSYEPQIAIPCTRILKFDGVIIKRTGKIKPLVRENRKTENWSSDKWTRKVAKFERKGGTIYNGTNQLNSNQIKLIKRMKSGDILHIQYGTLSCSSCMPRKIYINLRLTIK